jgi:hypothetical protein
MMRKPAMAAIVPIAPRVLAPTQLDRRATLAGFGAAAAGLFGALPAAYAATGSLQSTEIAKGVTQTVYGQGPSIIPGFKTVRLRDIVIQPGAEVDPNPMQPMICHMAQGELEVSRTNPDETFTAKTYRVWTCNTRITEGVVNKGSSVAVMRVIDLQA